MSERERILKDVTTNFETFFNTIDDFLFVADEKGCILHFNKTVEKRLGYTAEELKGKSILSVHPEELRSKTVQVLADVAAGNLYYFQIPLVTKQGKQIQVETHVNSGIWNGKPALFGVSQDITKLKLSEEKFSSAFYLNPSACGISDATTGKYIEVNDAFLKFFGYTREEAVGHTSTELNIINEKIRASILSKTDLLGRISNSEAELTTKNGDHKKVLLSGQIIHVQDSTYLYTVVHDVTEIHKAKELAEENEKKFSIAFHSSPNVSLITDIETGEILEANDAVEQVAGYTRAEIIGNSVFNLNFWVVEGAREQFIDRLVRDKRVMDFESRFRTKSGESFFGLISGQVIQIKNQNCVLSVIHDITDIKNAEAELLKAIEKVEESEKKFKNLYESLSIAYLILKDGVCIECNEATLNIYGVTNKDEIIGKTPIDFSPEFQLNNAKSSSEAKRQIQAALEKGFHTFEWISMRKNKEEFYSEISLKKYYHKNELYIQCLVADIAERKKVEAELIAAKEHSAESESFLRTLLNTLPDLVWLKDLKGVYMTCNKPMEEFLGKTEDDIIGKTDYDFLSADLADFFRQSDIEAVNAEKPMINEELISIAGKNHTVYLETIKTPFYRNSELLGVLGIGRNITERKNAEFELLKAKENAEESEIKFRQLAENLNDVIWLRKENEIMYINPAFDEMFGIPREVFYENSNLLYDVMHPKDIQKYRDALHTKEFAETGKFYCEYRIIRPNNDIRWIISKSSPIVDSKGNQTSYRVGIAIDITKLKNIEAELISAKERAEESDRLKTAFLHNMSHEIRTPLNAISGFTGLLNDPDITEDELNWYIQIIQNNSSQLVSIVSDILTISSLETKQEKINISDVCINDLFVELHAIFNQQAVAKNISLIVEKPLSDNQSIIFTDKTKITQVLSNLLSNAIKFTQEGFIEFGYYLNSDREPVEIEFYVKDSGIGINPEYHDKIFERFGQASKSINKIYGGTGLGLAISKAFIELLGGKIWVKSESEKGSTFYFTLPYKPCNQN